MYLLTVVFGPTGVTWGFLFKTEETADEAYNRLFNTTSRMQLCDDFGQNAVINLPIHAFMLEDLELSKIAQIERGLHHARTQAKANQMAQADPVIRAGNMSRGSGLATIDPMGQVRQN